MKRILIALCVLPLFWSEVSLSQNNEAPNLTAIEIFMCNYNKGKDSNDLDKVVDKWNVDLENLHIIVDDVDLHLGTMRIRPRGGDGCHRGMESVIYQLNDNKFPRIRFGIKADDHKRPAEKYVLKPFLKQDQELAGEMVQRTADAIFSIINIGLNRTMNEFNRIEKTEEVINE